MQERFGALVNRVKDPRLASRIAIVATLVTGIMIGTIITYGVRGEEKRFASDAAELQVPAPQQLSSAFSQIADRIEPTVVNINTESVVQPTPRQRRGPRGQEDDEMQDFFDRFFGGPTPQGPGGGDDIRERSLGSGVIVDSKGYILTNAHVVERADRIRVALPDEIDGQLYDAKVIGSDRETDLAVIKIETKRALPVAKMGNSDSMKVGDWVLAIGSPFGLDQSVTAGIVSAKGRNLIPRQQFQSFIQTDAAINPGNSGGPLVNMNGEVIGINTAIYTQSYGYQGVGFAMPSNVAVNVYNQLIGPEHKVTRGSIGVQFSAQPNSALKRVYGVKGGVILSDVIGGSPAQEAGLKVGDAIVAVDGKPIQNGDELVGEISSRKPGSKVKLTVVRNGKEEPVSVTVQDRARLFGEDESASDENPAEPAESKMGVTVGRLTNDMAERLNIPSGKGVVIEDVKPGSFADDTGLSRGDVILEINRQPINSPEDFRRLQSQLKSGQDVAFLIRPRGQEGTSFLAGVLP
jgi:serine protease Do